MFRVWEAIWSAKSVSTANFVLFIAAALVEFYRDIIIGNNMDFTDISKCLPILFLLIRDFTGFDLKVAWSNTSTSVYTLAVKFFNEMAERHDANAILRIARGLVREIQTMIDEL